uniref:Uncharacterized protein n=1 Tax=Rhizophora mucronata TaxID=61149 RepID=A0A2P2K9X7_RHIMU
MGISYWVLEIVCHEALRILYTFHRCLNLFALHFPDQRN